MWWVNLSISNNPYLETMYFSFNSSKNLHSLTVSNNSRLRTISTQHGKGGIFYCNYNLGTFINVPTVTFSSISFFFCFIFDLPNLTSFYFGNCTLLYTTTLVLSSSIILSTLAALFSYYFQYLVSFTFVYLKNLYGHWLVLW